ncbi:MAG: dienelactone hydrolase family protein [Pseudomonadota bacterium]
MKKITGLMAGFWIFLGSALPALAEVRSQAVEYHDGDTALKSYVYWDDALSGKRPGVMVVHEWWGLNDYAKQRAKMLAEQGYVAFAADMYGDRRVTEHAKEAKGWMEQITANLDAWQQRAALGLAQLKTRPEVDGERLAAIGYCFGGATVMQMAYAGLPLKAVVSFHGSLPPVPESHKAIQPRILIAHGAADGFVPKERIEAFTAALNAAGAHWEMDTYGGAKHGFTNPDADKAGIDGLAYQATADHRSWARLLAFLKETLSP